METLMMGAITWWRQVLMFIFGIVCVLLIIIVLLQKGRGGGLVGALGGAGGQSAFGSKTGDVFTWITVVFVGVFLVMAAFLSSPIGYVPTSTIADTPIAPPGASGGPGSVPSESGPPTNPESGPPTNPESGPAPKP